MANCLVLLRHLIWFALDLALASAGSSMAARMAMMAMTTSNSIRVKPCALVVFGTGRIFISIAGASICRKYRIRTGRKPSDVCSRLVRHENNESARAQRSEDAIWQVPQTRTQQKG